MLSVCVPFVSQAQEYQPVTNQFVCAAEGRFIFFRADENTTLPATRTTLSNAGLEDGFMKSNLLCNSYLQGDGIFKCLGYSFNFPDEIIELTLNINPVNQKKTASYTINGKLRREWDCK